VSVLALPSPRRCLARWIWQPGCSEKTISVGPLQQTSRFISEVFSDVSELAQNFDGSLTVTSDTPVAIVGLRFRGTNFSTIPITSLSDPTPVPVVASGVGGSNAIILPQFAAGGDWSSEIVISNTTDVQMSFRLDLFKQDGTPLNTTLNSLTGSSFTNLMIPAEGLLILTNNDPGNLQVGYAIVTPLDTTPPMVTLTEPVAGDNTSGVPVNQKLTATFSEPMDPSTINATSFTLNQGSTSIAGTVTYSGIIASFAPATNLAPSTIYRATITTDAKDADGNPLASNFVWVFVTTGAGTAKDTTSPTVSFTAPVNAAATVPINQKVSATFSKAIDPTTITSGTFTLSQGAVPIAGSVAYIGLTGTFTPGVSLSAGTTYTATITTGVKDLAGNALASNYVWSFTTTATPDTTAPTVTSTDPATLSTAVALNKKIANYHCIHSPRLIVQSCTHSNHPRPIRKFGM